MSTRSPRRQNLKVFLHDPIGAMVYPQRDVLDTLKKLAVPGELIDMVDTQVGEVPEILGGIRMQLQVVFEEHNEAVLKYKRELEERYEELIRQINLTKTLLDHESADAGKAVKEFHSLLRQCYEFRADSAIRRNITAAIFRDFQRKFSELEVVEEYISFMEDSQYAGYPPNVRHSAVILQVTASKGALVDDFDRLSARIKASHSPRDLQVELNREVQDLVKRITELMQTDEINVDKRSAPTFELCLLEDRNILDEIGTLS